MKLTTVSKNAKLTKLTKKYFCFLSSSQTGRIAVASHRSERIPANVSAKNVWGYLNHRMESGTIF